jgi:uncharacterized protein
LRKLLITSSLVLMLQIPVVWAGFDEGLVAAEKSDYITALQHWQPLAAQGHPASQFNLALMYHHGNGLPRNLEQAAHWYRKAAEQGYANAQNSLGALYESGDGIPKDLAEAVKWYRLSAAQGNKWGQRNLQKLQGSRPAPVGSSQ